MVRKEYTPRKSLRDEHIDKIVGEGIGPQSIRITIEHDIGDKQPIAIEIQKEWYGDTRENFRTEAESHGLKPSVILDLDREIGTVVLDMIDEIIKEHEKRSDEEIALRQQQKRAAQIVAAAGPSEERIETELTAASLGDFTQPIPVKQALFAEPGSIITVYGQISAMGKIHSMIEGGQFQCNHCHGIQYIPYERPSHPSDDEAPAVMHVMCRFCDEQEPPLQGLQTPIEEMPGFEPFKDDPDLANKFLRFAERKLTNNKADHCHNPSIKSCLFRVPGTYNTKAKAAGKNPVVRILRGYEYLDGAILDTYSLSQSRPTTKFLNDFHAFLVQQEINDKIAKSERQQQRIIGNGISSKTDNNSIWWIEKLLRAGVEDGRKDMLFWVLVPYLVSVHKMDYDKAYSTLEQWLARCNDVRRLEPSRCAFRYRLRYCLDTAQNQERMPIRFETFQEYYPDVYKLLMEAPKAHGGVKDL